MGRSTDIKMVAKTISRITDELEQGFGENSKNRLQVAAAGRSSLKTMVGRCRLSVPGVSAGAHR